jgi:hypothetical protein
VGVSVSVILSLALGIIGSTHSNNTSPRAPTPPLRAPPTPVPAPPPPPPGAVPGDPLTFPIPPLPPSPPSQPVPPEGPDPPKPPSSPALVEHPPSPPPPPLLLDRLAPLPPAKRSILPIEFATVPPAAPAVPVAALPAAALTDAPASPTNSERLPAVSAPTWAPTVTV